MTGLAPATRMTISGSYWSSRLHATVASTASATSVHVGAGGRKFRERRAGPGDRDDRSTGLGERAGDPTPQAPARADDDRGPVGEVTHHRPFPFVIRNSA